MGKHNDCRNFVPVDVSKGICRVSGNMILIDTDTCENFSELPKCKNCASFVPGEAEGFGTCKGEKKDHWTYPELMAVTCGMYARK